MVKDKIEQTKGNWDTTIDLVSGSSRDSVDISQLLAYEYCLASERITYGKVSFEDMLDKLFDGVKKFRIGNPVLGMDDECLYGKGFDDTTAIPVTSKLYRMVMNAGAQHLDYFKDGKFTGAVFIYERGTIKGFAKDENGNPVYSKVKNYTDTADTGDDYLCSIDYVEYNQEAYIINVIFTKDGMEITEPAVAKMLFDDKVNEADIESNNGGRGFARNVETLLLQKFNSNRCIINTFYQSKNKQSRILSNSTWVMNHIYFPVNWADRFPDYYDSMIRYQKEGKNAHDDAQDATTGIAEKIGQGDRFSFD